MLEKTIHRTPTLLRTGGDYLDSLAMVALESLPGCGALPLVIRAKSPGMVLSEWFNLNREWLEARLLVHGGILFRDFDLRTDEDFSAYMNAIPYQSTPYYEGSTPRKRIAGNIYTSTVYPKEETIALHNELTSSMKYPLKVWFFCAESSEWGGETPFADTRKITKRIDPEVMAEFRRKGWLLVRNYGYGLGLTWQDAFKMDDKQKLAAYCEENDIELHWKDEQHLVTRQIRQATVSHPITGEELWFNHIAFWHPANLRPEVRMIMEEELGPEGLPFRTYYGDGTPISDEVGRHLHEAYLKEKIKFPWLAGDLMMIDNLTTSHGREPYRGERRIRVAMAEVATRKPWRPTF